MSEAIDAAVRSAPARIAPRDLLALAKPRITTLVVFTCASGLWFAPHDSLSRARIALTILATVGVVAAANALNMFLERDTDALMKRTRNRPLPSGRMAPVVALWFGLGLAAVSVPALTFGVGPVPGLLASLALCSYVLLYTPMKRRSAASLLVGGFPGAIPPLIGWSAATGGIELGGFLLFAMMFLWQVPHFLAICVFRKDEFGGAGLVVQPNQPGGERATRINTVRYAVALWPVSLLFVPLGEAGRTYFWTALVAGFLFVAAALAGLRPSAGVRWARGLFSLSLLYLTVVFGVLMFDRAAVPGVNHAALAWLAAASALLVFLTEAAILFYKLRSGPSPERPLASRLLWSAVPAATLAGLCIWCSLLIP